MAGLHGPTLLALGRRIITGGVLWTVLAAGALAEEPPPQSRTDRIEQLEQTVRQLVEEVRTLKRQQAEGTASTDARAKQLGLLSRQLAELDDSAASPGRRLLEKLSIGGYGEIHANFSEAGGDDQFDLHRLVLYLGYDFTDWIKLNTEIELEHGFVSRDSGGEVGMEQAYLDFFLWPSLNVRAGRLLTPLGIVNARHEPPSFNGVERPSFARYIIPSTWSSDGVGIFGNLSPAVTYEAYLVGGLDGSRFDALGGIRGGRIKERPSLGDGAFTGRLDWSPSAGEARSHLQNLRLGLSTYLGGLGNHNKGRSSDIGGSIQIYSADAEFSVGRFDFRGAVAHEQISSAREIGNGTASAIVGWYAEVAYHILPDSVKKGKLADADAVVFARFDDVDTQYGMPSGVARDPRGDRQEVTLGVGFYPTRNFVIKADYQIRRDASGDDPDNLINLGLGFEF